MNERLKKIRKALDLTQQEFADRIGIARGNVGAYEINKNAPSDAVISLICREFNVNIEWLRTGKGEMFLELTSDEEIDTDAIKNHIIGAVSIMNDTYANKVWNYILTLFKEEGGKIER